MEGGDPGSGSGPAPKSGCSRRISASRPIRRCEKNARIVHRPEEAGLRRGLELRSDERDVKGEARSRCPVPTRSVPREHRGARDPTEATPDLQETVRDEPANRLANGVPVIGVDVDSQQVLTRCALDRDHGAARRSPAVPGRDSLFREHGSRQDIPLCLEVEERVRLNRGRALAEVDRWGHRICRKELDHRPIIKQAVDHLRGRDGADVRSGAATGERRDDPRPPGGSPRRHARQSHGKERSRHEAPGINGERRGDLTAPWNRDWGRGGPDGAPSGLVIGKV